MCVINGNIGLEQLLGSVNPSSPIPQALDVVNIITALSVKAMDKSEVTQTYSKRIISQSVKCENNYIAEFYKLMRKFGNVLNKRSLWSAYKLLCVLYKECGLNLKTPQYIFVESLA